eukprot:11861965-Alexandrium_andersonii.AAC.1
MAESAARATSLANVATASREIYIARGPKSSPQSAHCSSVLQSASIRNPSFRKFEIDSGVRT